MAPARAVESEHPLDFFAGRSNSGENSGSSLLAMRGGSIFLICSSCSLFLPLLRPPKHLLWRLSLLKRMSRIRWTN
jgi:hypothetical protein